jgi:D-beta-D-heptose 7-phosphate kinase/D-beta-D-heptose 1-phosphate adenosyltransferase
MISKYDIILLSDYGKGVLTNQLTHALIEIAKKNCKKVLVDPKGKDYSKYKDAFLLTPNKKEASEATKVDIVDNDSLNKAIIELKNLCNLDFSLITLSENGIAVYDDNLRIHPTVAKEVFDVTGAGDTILASLGFAIAIGLDIDEAIKFSNLAGGVVVGKIGSATATLNEIIQYESSLHKSSSDVHIKTIKEIIVIARELKLNKKKIVFTNGCFDLLHVGHISYLEKAKSFGDVLIVGLNSDDSVKTLKGEGRPINNQLDRAYTLAALEVVDYVVIFHDETPLELIKSIEPNTIVKGGDYKNKKIVGQDIANELKLVDFVKGKSSTQTINKIKQS